MWQGITDLSSLSGVTWAISAMGREDVLEAKIVLAGATASKAVNNFCLNNNGTYHHSSSMTLSRLKF